MIPPGQTIGLMGGGQLGRMFALAARRLGYRVHTLEPTPDCPAGQVSDLEINAPYDDFPALDQLIAGVDVVTFEFENIPAHALKHLASARPVHPNPNVLHLCQNREREKNFLRSHDFPCAPFAVVSSAAELADALRSLGTPAVLKTADFGYDGKGQLKITDPAADPSALWEKFNSPRAVLEAWIPFRAEVSVVCARSASGETLAFPCAENTHTNHILDISTAPTSFGPELEQAAAELACRIAHALEVVGLLAVEMFVTTDGSLLVNELAPRPHNSGHYSLDACLTSQFEQQLRAICGLPLGDPSLLSPVAMVNLLGDLWRNGEPDWNIILKHPNAKLHLYGKAEARPGRKMGHFCVLAGTRNEALATARAIRGELLAAALSTEELAGGAPLLAGT